MEFETTLIKDLLLVRPSQYKDDRGVFSESWNSETFNEVVGQEISFCQDNESISRAGVIRGLHFQVPPSAQGKLVRVSRGAIIDVAVDLRRSSITYGKHFSVKLDAESRWQLWIPEGFAHGFASLKDETLVQYKCTAQFSPTCERSIIWNDIDLKINWGVKTPVLSGKDAKATSFSLFDTPF